MASAKRGGVPQQVTPSSNVIAQAYRPPTASAFATKPAGGVCTGPGSSPQQRTSPPSVIAQPNRGPPVGSASWLLSAILVTLSSGGGCAGRGPQHRTESSAFTAQVMAPEAAIDLAVTPTGTACAGSPQQVTSPLLLRAQACASPAVSSTTSGRTGAAASASRPQHVTTEPACGSSRTAHANSRPTANARARSPAGATSRDPPLKTGPQRPAHLTACWASTTQLANGPTATTSSAAFVPPPPPAEPPPAAEPPPVAPPAPAGVAPPPLVVAPPSCVGTPPLPLVVGAASFARQPSMIPSRPSNAANRWCGEVGR